MMILNQVYPGGGNGVEEIASAISTGYLCGFQGALLTY